MDRIFFAFPEESKKDNGYGFTVHGSRLKIKIGD
jgi:hypothetical protein